MKLIIGSDHAGQEYKEKIIEHFSSKKDISIIDSGTFQEVGNYAKEGIKVGENISMGNADFGIIICGTGIGISIAANKVKGVRAALCNNVEDAQLSREHNSANIIAMGSRKHSSELCIEMVEAFISHDFEGGRHLDRLNTVIDYEESCIDC